MKIWFMSWCLIWSCTCSLAVVESQESATKSSVAFLNVTLLPMDSEEVRPNQTVVVEGDRITAVGPTGQVQVPEGALRVDAQGRYLMPGLAEMHGHIPSPESEMVEEVLFLYLAGGVTTVRGMLGWDGQLELREKANRGEILSPTLYLAGPSFNDRSINSPQEAVEKVHRQKQEGWDLLKIHPGLTLAEYDAMAETARQVGIPFAGHVPADVGIRHALEKGQQTIDHLDGYVEYFLDQESGRMDEGRLREIVQLTREKGAWVVPTMYLWQTLLGVNSLEELQSFPELRFVPRAQLDAWTNAHRRRLANPNFSPQRAARIAAARRTLLAALQEGGVGILMGTDAPQQFSVPGFSILREIRLMEECGLTPYQILLSGTRNVGEYFADKDRFGLIREGHRADLLLLPGNPLEDLGHLGRLEGVMVRGRWLPRSEIQSRLQEVARQAGAQ